MCATLPPGSLQKYFRMHFWLKNIKIPLFESSKEGGICGEFAEKSFEVKRMIFLSRSVSFHLSDDSSLTWSFWVSPFLGEFGHDRLRASVTKQHH